MPRTCLITGGNAGIGKAAALQLAARGYLVAIGCRNPERGRKALEDVRRASPEGLGELVVMDMASRDSIRSGAADAVKKLGAPDAVIHNAADFDISRKVPVMSPDGIETVWATNHLGPVYLTELLLEALKRSGRGRIITVASQGLMLHPRLQVNTRDPEYRNRKFSVANAYYQSKLAQVMYTHHLAGELSGSGITVNCVRVTNVKIDTDRYPDLSPLMLKLYAFKSRFAISPGEMAEVYAWLTDDESLAGVTGCCFDEKKRRVSFSRYSRDEYEIRRVMKTTENYLKEGGN